jgi:hypothetical protein
MKNKIKLIIFGIVLLICIVVASCTGIFIFIMSGVVKQGQEIKENVLNEVCTGHRNFDTSKQAEWFSTRFISSNDYKTSQRALESAFPTSLNCASILPSNIFSMITSQQSIQISWINGVSTAEITYPVEAGNKITITLIKEGEDWKIDSIASTTFTF